jgi:hypothetical protein
MTSGATAAFTVYNGEDGVTVDAVLSDTSENPVQNQVVKAAIDLKADITSLASVATSGIYSDLTGKPSALSNFTDDLGATPTHTHAQYITDVSGKADLMDGLVPASQLPSYVDDVLEVAAHASLPVTGESGKIYITLDTNKTYRWSGSGYTEISASLALGETSSTAYRGDRGKTAYDHSQAAGNPHNTTAAQISGLINAIYPVGSIYMSVSSTSPSTLFGGTWVRLQGRFLLGAGENGANTTDCWGSLPAGTIYPPAGEMAGTDRHRHNAGTLRACIGAVDSQVSQIGYIATAVDPSTPTANYKFSATGEWPPQDHTFSQQTDVAGDTSFTMTLPPYLVVYMWKRTG